MMTLEELDARREKILSKSGPLRKELDALVKETMVGERKLREKIVSAEKDLYDIDMERAKRLRAGSK